MSLANVDREINWREFLEYVVLKENEDAKGVILNALPYALRIKVDVVIFDPNDATTVINICYKSRI